MNVRKKREEVVVVVRAEAAVRVEKKDAVHAVAVNDPGQDLETEDPKSGLDGPVQGQGPVHGGQGPALEGTVQDQDQDVHGVDHGDPDPEGKDPGPGADLEDPDHEAGQNASTSADLDPGQGQGADLREVEVKKRRDDQDQLLEGVIMNRKGVRRRKMKLTSKHLTRLTTLRRYVSSVLPRMQFVDTITNLLS